MSERSRSVAGKVSVPPPGEAPGVVCPACWTELPYDNDLCFACAHPVADAFAGNTVVVSPPGGPATPDFDERTTGVSQAQVRWVETGTMVTPPTGQDTAGLGQRAAPAAAVTQSPGRTVTQPMLVPPLVCAPEPQPGFDEQPPTQIITVLARGIGVPIPIDPE